jgi:hypothetical protein
MDAILAFRKQRFGAQTQFDASTAEAQPHAREHGAVNGLPLFMSGLNQGQGTALQTKLTVSQPKDVYEQEADRIADEVISGASLGMVQRQCACDSNKGRSGGCDQCQNAEQSLQRSSAVISDGPAPAVANEAMSSSSGQALGGPSRAKMESRFGEDFSDVTLHSDEAAAEAARAVKAKAFTVGRDIYLDRTHYHPGTKEGQHLLAHELTHVVQQRGGAKPAIMRIPLSEQLPSGIGLVWAAVSFSLPGGKALTGDWNDLSTTDLTQVSLTISSTGIDLRMSPGFLIDAQWPVSDMVWRSLVYNFRTASLTSIDLESTQDLAVGAPGMASSRISAFFTTLLAGTRVATSGYDPHTDPDLVETLNAIKVNFERMPSESPGDVTASDVRSVEISTQVSFTNEIRSGTGDGGVVIPSGGNAIFRVEFEGSAEDMSSPATRRVRTVTIESESITLQSGGSDVARLQSLYIESGGRVSLGRFRALGGVGVGEGLESLVRLGILVEALSHGTPSDRLALEGRTPNIGPDVVHENVRAQIEQALTRAVRELILTNCHSLPGVNLCNILGVPEIGDFNARPPSARNATG